MVQKRRLPQIEAALRQTALEAQDLALLIASLAIGHQAENVALINLSRLSSYTDFCVVVSGTSARHVRAIVDHVMEELKLRRAPLLGVEGYDLAQWVLLDYGSVVAHVFQPETRDFYDLDGFWADAPRLPPPATSLAGAGPNPR